MELTPAARRLGTSKRRSTPATVLTVLLFVAWVAEWPVALDPGMYNGLWRSPFALLGPLFVPLPGIRLFAWQLLLIGMVPVCLIARGAFKQRARELDRALLTSVAAIAITFLWGMARGGSPYFAYYQLWRFLAGLLVAYLFLCVLRTPKDLTFLAKSVVSAALIRGTLCIYFYWTQIRGSEWDSRLEYLTNHDDALLCVAAILITGSWAVTRGGSRAWFVAMATFPYLGYAMVLNDRRVAWVELAMAAVTLYFMLERGPLRRRIHRWALIAGPVLLAYVAVGWGREGALFAPVKALSSVGSSYDPSSLTRQEEIRNLLYTLSASGNPLIGTGWGLQFQKVESFWSNYSPDWIFDLYNAPQLDSRPGRVRGTRGHPRHLGRRSGSGLAGRAQLQALFGQHPSRGGDDRGRHPRRVQRARIRGHRLPVVPLRSPARSCPRHGRQARPLE